MLQGSSPFSGGYQQMDKKLAYWARRVQQHFIGLAYGFDLRRSSVQKPISSELSPDANKYEKWIRKALHLPWSPRLHLLPRGERGTFTSRYLSKTGVCPWVANQSTNLHSLQFVHFRAKYSLLSKKAIFEVHCAFCVLFPFLDHLGRASCKSRHQVSKCAHYDNNYSKVRIIVIFHSSDLEV